MNDSKKANGLTEITPEDHVNNAHRFLKEYLSKFESAKRGGIHDFIEISLANMVNAAIANIDIYLQDGHKQVSATEVTHIVTDSFQGVLDNMKRNLEHMKQVNFR